MLYDPYATTNLGGLRSRPTSDVPLGMITPPWTLLILYSALLGLSKSKLLLTSSGGKSSEVVPDLSLYVFAIWSWIGIHPGLLSQSLKNLV